MNKRVRVAYISTFAPRVCGIASFTRDLILATNDLNDVEGSKIVALDRGQELDYGAEVVYHFIENDRNKYVKAANFLNESGFNVVSLQHEYGLYGGDYGEYILDLIKTLKKPLVTTFHMISPKHEMVEKQRWITQKIGEYSKYVVAISETGKKCLSEVYEIPIEKIKMIPHGAPDIRRGDLGLVKNKVGFESDGIVLTSINILRPSRGIDLVIKALPKIVKHFPNISYLVVGRDPPNADQPYSYRLELENLVNELGLKSRVRFENRYVPTEELIGFIKATDIFITPYRPPEQSSSGSLAYAVVAGKVCISTPYNYAEELLDNGRGVVVPWLDSTAIEKAVIKLLGNQKLMKVMGEKAYKYGRNMIWSNVAKKYVKLFIAATNGGQNEIET